MYHARRPADVTGEIRRGLPRAVLHVQCSRREMDGHMLGAEGEKEGSNEETEKTRIRKS